MRFPSLLVYWIIKCYNLIMAVCVIFLFELGVYLILLETGCYHYDNTMSF